MHIAQGFQTCGMHNTFARFWLAINVLYRVYTVNV